MNGLHQYAEIEKNPGSVRLNQVPVLSYYDFYRQTDYLMEDASNHCLNYFAVDYVTCLQFFCLIANDSRNKILVYSHVLAKDDEPSLEPITKKHFQFHVFEREIHENFNILFPGHPWLKPLRFSHYRADKSKIMDNYPFYTLPSEELHLVGVGPVHAGVIEPGHFKFICNGENVLHLEIQLGYQHRGIEKLMLTKKHPLQRMVISESIAGDTAIGHGLAHALTMESLSGFSVPSALALERSIALELERIAIHIGDTSALCTDIAYQLGQVVNEALRTTIINTTQYWCGNRFGKGLIRPFGTYYPLSNYVIQEIRKILDDSGRRYFEMADRILNLPSVLSRFDNIGKISREQANSIGTVGMAARSAGIKRDIRHSHPFLQFCEKQYEPVIEDAGDIMARAKLRKTEIEKSIALIYNWLDKFSTQSFEKSPLPDYSASLLPNSISVALTEGWRGEICHCAITDNNGELFHYKIKDPSLHNWMALALALRDLEISDFPVTNKSFNLSYCGHDL